MNPNSTILAEAAGDPSAAPTGVHPDPEFDPPNARHAAAPPLRGGLSELLARPPPHPQTLVEMLGRCLDEAGLSTGLLYMAEDEGRHRLRAQFGITAERQADAEALFGHEPLIRRIVESGNPVVLSAAAADGDAASRDFVSRLGQSSVLVIPLVGLGETVGELVLASGDHDLSDPGWIAFARSLSVQLGQSAALGRDVTERNLAEKALRSAQDRLEHVLSFSPAVLYSLRVDGERVTPTWTSPNVERLTGYRPQQISADWWTEHIHPEDRQRVLAEAPEVLRKGSGIREYRFRHPDGSYHWIRDEQVLIPHQGGPDEVVGSWFDITDRKEAEFKVHESEQQYRLLFDHNPLPMSVVDRETLRFLAVNDAAVREYGYSREEFLGLGLSDIRLPEQVGGLTADYDRDRAENPSDYRLDGTRKHLKKGGAEIEVEIARSAIEFRGRPAWLTLVVNVTERRILEDKLARSQKMEAVGQLAGGIAHDFNNLLGVITGYSELLINGAAPESRERKRGEEIKAAADRATALTRQLLAFGRRQILLPTVLDLSKVVADVERLLRRVIGADIHIVTESASGLGRVRADAGQIEQVLMNLAVNARDAMPSGGRLLIETANVVLDATYLRTKPDVLPGDYVMLAVSDTGHGMDAHTVARIFEPFFTTKEEGKGTGLGLATVYGIVHQSGGLIDVYSEPGQGTRFQVYLPRVTESARSPGPVEPGAAPGGSETILVVEDADALRLLVRELLEGAGYTVLDAEGPERALAILHTSEATIGLVLTDLVMPQMSGQELAARLAVLRPAAKVMFMSGYSEQAFGGQGTLGLGTHFLQKPFTMNALLRAVRRAFDS